MDMFLTGYWKLRREGFFIFSKTETAFFYCNPFGQNSFVVRVIRASYMYTTKVFLCKPHTGDILEYYRVAHLLDATPCSFVNRHQTAPYLTQTSVLTS